MNHKLKQIVYPIYEFFNPVLKPIKKIIYNANGKKPWSIGYVDVKWEAIKNAINNAALLTQIRNTQQLPQGFGLGLDERVVEYSWLFSQFSNDEKVRLLDAGSTFNFKPLLQHPIIKHQPITLFTFYPEIPSFKSYKNTTYVYGDLRAMPFKDASFDLVFSQSTIEHIGMDNSLYGYTSDNRAKQKDYSHLKAIEEMVRVLADEGKLLLTFPYGTYEHHDFFQQFDSEMVDGIVTTLKKSGLVKLSFAKYGVGGWQFADQSSCNESTSHNPHTGKGKGTDGAAHSRAICLLVFEKNKLKS